LILVDHREKNSGIPDELQRLGVPIKLLQLEVGDYIVTGEENICVERKDSKDYLQSLLSGRLNNQLVAMSRNYGYSLLLIEGTISTALFEGGTSRHVYLSSLVGSFVKRALDGKSGVVSIIPVDTPYDSALALKFLHDKNNDPKGLIRLPKLNSLHFSREEVGICMLSTIPGIGQRLAKNILSKFHTLQNVANASESELREIPKVGPKKSSTIFEFFRFFYK